VPLPRLLLPFPVARWGVRSGSGERSSDSTWGGGGPPVGSGDEKRRRRIQGDEHQQIQEVQHTGGVIGTTAPPTSPPPGTPPPQSPGGGHGHLPLRLPVRHAGDPSSFHGGLTHAPPTPHGPCRSRPHPGQAWQQARRSGRSCPFAASPPPNRSRERESRDAENRFADKAISRGRLTQLRAKQLPKLLAKLCQRHPNTPSYLESMAFGV
jgi:hypothetical protein